MKTIHEMMNLENQFDKPAPKNSGFFDLPSKKYCEHPEHTPPKYLHIPQGKGYRHVCPKCGHVQEIIPPQISF